jgi:WD40 repeat protein
MSCAFSPQGNLVVSGSDDRTLRLWAVSKEAQREIAPQAVLNGHENMIRACAFSPARDQVVSGGDDWTLQFLAVSKEAQEEIAPQAVLYGHKGTVTACAFVPSGCQVVSGSDDKTLRLWDIRDTRWARWDIRSTNTWRVRCVRIVTWCSQIRSLGLYPNYFSGVGELAEENAKHPALEEAAVLSPPAPQGQLVVGDGAGLVTLWQWGADDQLHLVSLPPQPGVLKVWRDSWKSVNLTGARVTKLAKALLKQYSGKALKEGAGKNQVQAIEEIPEPQALSTAAENQPAAASRRDSVSARALQQRGSFSLPKREPAKTKAAASEKSSVNEKKEECVMS